MVLNEKIAELDAFVPTNTEHEDVERLWSLTDRLETTEEVQAALPALLRIFERFPDALLGSPGPVVHCIERVGLESFLPMLLQSFSTHPTRMTLWMLERCLRSDPLPESRRCIVRSLIAVREEPQGGELASDIDEILDGYGRT